MRILITLVALAVIVLAVVARAWQVDTAAVFGLLVLLVGLGPRRFLRFLAGLLMLFRAAAG